MAIAGPLLLKSYDSHRLKWNKQCGKLEHMGKALRLAVLTIVVYAVASYLSFVC